MSHSLVDRLVEKQNWMEKPADAVQKLVGGCYKVLGPPGRGLKNMMHGTWPLGHPFHPAISDFPVGAWTLMLILDIVSHYTSAMPHRAAEVALLVGIVAALGAAASGYTDFHETYGHERRVAFTHGVTMTLALILMIVSLLLRHYGSAGTYTVAVIISWIGVVLVLSAAYLGGHMVFGIGTMVNRNAFAVQPEDFVDVGAAGEFAEGQLRRVMAGDYPALVVRREGKLCAIAAVCSHAGGPLEEGKLEGDVVECPWHGSRFNVCTGAALRGPATFAQPQFEVREENGRVSLKGTAAH